MATGSVAAPTLGSDWGTALGAAAAALMTEAVGLVGLGVLLLRMCSVAGGGALDGASAAPAG